MKQVRLVVTNTVVSDQTVSVKMYVDDMLIETFEAKPAINTLTSALTFMQGYMSSCPHTIMCAIGSGCKREPIPFTFTIEIVRQRQYQTEHV